MMEDGGNDPVKPPLSPSCHRLSATPTLISYTPIQNHCLYTPLAEADPEVAKIIEDETWRQFSGLELIASEVSVAQSTGYD
jgi:glycine hydroxymethyltransferase